jgi:AraC-like DNA-binding protein
VRDIENGVVRWLRPGEFTIGRALDSLYMRTQGEELLLLSIEWNLGSLGTSAPIGLPTGGLHPLDVVRLTADAGELLSPDTAASETVMVGVIGRVMARLRAAGVPFDCWRAKDLLTPVPGSLQRVADAVGGHLSRIGDKPGTADLEAALGVSRRRVAQLVAELSSRYGMNGTDWRTMRDRWRLQAAMLAMSHREARTEEVARAVGYGSPNAFCHAFREAKLPSPGLIRTALARLG